MKFDRTMTVMLGVNAVLTAGLLWTNLVGLGPLGRSVEAAPQYRSPRSMSPLQGAAELTGAAGASTRQRKQIIERLDAINRSIVGLENTLKSGNVPVRVENLGEISLDIDYDRMALTLRKAAE